MTEFKTGDQVTFCAYLDQYKTIKRSPLTCSVTSVKKEGDKVLYQLSGKALSLTSGMCIVESELFKPFKKAFDLMIKYNLYPDDFNSGYITSDLFEYRFKNSDRTILIRVEQGITELFNGLGRLVK